MDIYTIIIGISFSFIFSVILYLSTKRTFTSLLLYFMFFISIAVYFSLIELYVFIIIFILNIGLLIYKYKREN